jgi:hypothetical protein
MQTHLHMWRRRIQKNALGLEELIATGEAEQRGERVAGGQEGDDKDSKRRLAQLELRCISGVEAGQDEVAARVLAPVPKYLTGRHDSPS